jgi:hypothetical protein
MLLAVVVGSLSVLLLGVVLDAFGGVLIDGEAPAELKIDLLVGGE